MIERSGSDRAAQILELRRAEWRQAPGRARAAIVERTENIHSVRCLQEDALQPESLRVRPATSRRPRNAFAEPITRNGDVPTARANDQAQRVVRFIQGHPQLRTRAV